MNVRRRDCHANLTNAWIDGDRCSGSADVMPLPSIALVAKHARSVARRRDRRAGGERADHCSRHHRGSGRPLVLGAAADGKWPAANAELVGCRSVTGDIYVAGMDHQTNSALYRLRLNTLTYLGDARATSTAAGNWLTNETAEKFHTHPTWLNGTDVATLPDSNLNASYLAKRGFHWYRYTAASATFTDLSAGIGTGVAIDHGVKIAADPALNVIYAAINPTGQILRFNVGRNEATP